MDSSSMAGKQNRFKLTIKDIGIIAIFSSLLFVQEELLTALPNIQLTVFLIVLYSKKFGFVRTSIIVTIHVILDNLFMSSFSLVYTPAMWVGWMLIPCVICALCKKVNHPFVLALIGAFLSIVYCWCFIPPVILIYHMNFLAYLISDLPFEGLIAASSFLSILLLYSPLSDAMDRIYVRTTGIDPNSIE